MSSRDPRSMPLWLACLLSAALLPLCAAGWLAGLACLALRAGYVQGQDWLSDTVNRPIPGHTDDDTQETDT